MSEKKQDNTLEAQTAVFVREYLKEAKIFAKNFRLNKIESMLVLNRFELAKIHSHIDPQR